LFLYNDIDVKFRDSMRTVNLFELHKETELIIVRSNREYFTQWSQNKFVNPRLPQLGFDSKNFTFSQTLHFFYNRLFNFSPLLQPKYEQFLKKAKPSAESKLICMQVRVGGYFMNGFVDPIRSRADDVKLMWDFVKRNFTAKLDANSTEYRIFLTTDNERVKKNALAEYGNKLIINEGKAGHIDRWAGHMGDDECGDISTSAMTILDFHCMQHCDMAIVTGSSRFGRFALVNREHLEKGSYFCYHDKNFWPLEKNF
jgi:hypothetical protein